MDKLFFFAFVLSPGVLFAFLRPPEPPPPNLTLAGRVPCQVAAAYPPSRQVGSDISSGEVGRFVSLPGNGPRKPNP